MKFHRKTSYIHFGQFEIFAVTEAAENIKKMSRKCAIRLIISQKYTFMYVILNSNLIRFFFGLHFLPLCHVVYIISSRYPNGIEQNTKEYTCWNLSSTSGAFDFGFASIVDIIVLCNIVDMVEVHVLSGNE